MLKSKFANRPFFSPADKKATITIELLQRWTSNLLAHIACVIRKLHAMLITNCNTKLKRKKATVWFKITDRPWFLFSPRLVQLYSWMKSIAVWLERLTINAKAATVLGSMPASSVTVESEGRQMKQSWRTDFIRKNHKNSPLNYTAFKPI